MQRPSNDPEQVAVPSQPISDRNVKEARGGEKTPPDFQDPHDMPFWRKVNITAWLGCMTLTTTFCSSIFSATIPATSKEFNTTNTVMILTVSLYVTGLAFGPLIWGPLSEAVGRKIPLFTGFVLFAIIQIPTALVRNLAGLLILRFLAGAFGASTVALVSATYADFWGVVARGNASAIYSVVCFVGPCIGPIAGIYITDNLGWRWVAWISLMMAAFFGIPAFIVLPETYAPVLKKEPKPTLKQFASKYLMRPALMLGHEVMLDVMTLHGSLVYALQYLTFFAIPHIFTTERNWPYSSATLPFLSMLLGIISASLAVAVFYDKWYRPRFIARGGIIRPEDRLPPVMLGAILLPIGLFWLAWSSETHWFVQVLALYFLGAGILLVFAVGFVYIIDIYLPVAASAVAANGFVRSMLATGLPLAAPKMYETMGSEWATTLLAFLCVVLVPAPFLFWKYGERMRKSSRYAVS